MGIKERREKERVALRERIISEARKIFLEEGYEKVSMRNIAAKIEYSPTTIYLYFKNKGELLNSIVAEYYESVRRDIVGMDQSQLDSITFLEKVLQIYGYRAIEENSPYLIIINNYKVEGDKISSHKGFDGLENLVKDCIKEGSIIDNDSTLIVQGIWMSLYGVINLLLTQPNYPWKDRRKLIDHTISTHLKGLSAK
jgi:hypothetical protein